ncbi:unnamed protein product [Nezara viridula]|uniref:Uncharacterized protein n=1 Tax=Nezara viridula TaxID=85310 RepID=A0A9P0MTI5_NEZVI|nr:unnamed protein product [Nezara viridula]
MLRVFLVHRNSSSCVRLRDTDGSQKRAGMPEVQGEWWSEPQQDHSFGPGVARAEAPQLQVVGAAQQGRLLPRAPASPHRQGYEHGPEDINCEEGMWITSSWLGPTKSSRFKPDHPIMTIQRERSISESFTDEGSQVAVGSAFSRSGQRQEVQLDEVILRMIREPWRDFNIQQRWSALGSSRAFRPCRRQSSCSSGADCRAKTLPRTASSEEHKVVYEAAVATICLSSLLSSFVT